METYNWTGIGKEHSGTDEARDNIKAAYKAFDWKSLKGTKATMSFAAGMAIKEAIKVFRIPAQAVAESPALAPFGFYGIRAMYKGNKAVDVLIIDEGDSCFPVCTIVLQEGTV